MRTVILGDNMGKKRSLAILVLTASGLSACLEPSTNVGLIEERQDPPTASESGSNFLESPTAVPYQEPGSPRTYGLATLSFNFTDQECDAIALKEPGLFLTTEDSEFYEQAERKMKSRIPPSIQIVTQPQGSDWVDFEFFTEGKKLCRHDGRAIQRGSEIVVIGKVPKDISIDPVSRKPEVWDQSGDAIDGIVAAIVEQLAEPNISESDISIMANNITMNKCLAAPRNHQGSYLPCWDLLLEDESDNVTYQALVCYEQATGDQQLNQLVVEAHPYQLERTGTLSAYRKEVNSEDIKLTMSSYEVGNMSDGGTLCDRRFRTYIPRNVPKAFSSEGKFDFEPDDVRFREVSFFAYVSDMASWLITNFGQNKEGKYFDDEGNPTVSWPGPQITLQIDYNAVDYGRSITAVYNPEKGGLPPRITMGLGDDIKLQNLLVDPEAAQHEIVHHLVFRYMRSTSGIQVVLHEAYADFFVYLKTGDRCLGENVCPVGSPICISDRCLRSGNIKHLQIDTPEYNAMKPHRKSQMISGFLFDIVDRMQNEIRVGQLVFNSIRYLTRSSEYSDFLNALAEARNELGWSDEEYCHIKRAAIGRGMEPYLDKSEDRYYGKSCPGEPN